VRAARARPAPSGRDQLPAGAGTVRLRRRHPRLRHRLPAGGGGFSFGFPVDFRIKDIVDVIPGQCWYPALETDG